MLADTNHGASCLHLWHRRFGHRDTEAVKKIVQRDLGSGLKIDQCNVKSVCGSCCEGKMSRESFPKASSSRASAVGDLVHTDLGGPIEVPTARGSRFYMSMVDDYSRYTIIYLIRNKSDAEDRIREYCALVKTQFDHYPKVIRSDGGGEYGSNSLKKYFDDHGIVHHRTAPYSPQQNGVAERKNRYLVEMMRCMLADSNMDKVFWGEAISTANYLQNRLPSSSVASTPYELWHRKKPSYEHLRVFGSEAFVHIPKEKRRKLDKKAKKLVFVGYADGQKAYRFVNLETKGITISRDAKFLEHGEDKNVQKPKPTTSGGVVVLPLESTSPPPPLEEPNANDDSVNLDVSQYDSATDDDLVDEPSFHGFPLDEVARRSTRATKGIAPVRLIEEAYTAGTSEAAMEPRNLKEALACETRAEWRSAMKSELESHEENSTWDALVELPAGRKVVGCRWVFKLKRDAAGEVTKHKARLVAQGYSQQFGEDYDQVFAPVTSHVTLRMLLALASKIKMTLRHFDIKTAYLYGDLDQELFMRQPPGYEVKGKEHWVCRLKKSIYGLKQSARCWNQKLHSVLVKMGFQQSGADQCLYTKNVKEKKVYILVYVDDMMVGCVDEVIIDSVYQALTGHFDMTDLGQVSYFLGLEIKRENGDYSVSLEGYIDKLIRKFGLSDAKVAKTPMDEGFLKVQDTSESFLDQTQYRSLVGGLLYLSVCARPDIAVSTGILGRKVSAPTEACWVAAKRVVRYLKATKHWRLVYNGSGGGLIGYSDADWAGDAKSRKSTTGYVFCYAGGAVSWASRKQASVTLSSMESEYVALSEATQELVWLRRLMDDMGERVEGPVKMKEDNQSCIRFVNSDRTNRRSKHIETKEHFVKQQCVSGLIALEYCPTEDMVADVFTKPLGTTKQRKFSGMLGLSTKDGTIR